MNSALASLRGDAPIVRLHINVLPQAHAYPAVAAAEAAAASAAAAAAGEAQQQQDLAATPGRKEKESLLSKFGWCRSKQQFEGTVDSWSRHGERLVSVQLEVAGGVDLSLHSSHRKSRRVPSHEAIDLIAGAPRRAELPAPLGGEGACCGACAAPAGPRLARPPAGTCLQALQRGRAAAAGRRLP
jgi:hypothetical protein